MRIPLQSYSFFVIQMKLVKQIISNDKTSRSNTVQDIKNWNHQFFGKTS